MSQYAQSGSALDDAIVEEVDRGFIRVNQRLQLNQLQEGEVRESLNGRMEGYWKPRKNVLSVTGALTTGGDPLQLPFLLLAEDPIVISNAVSSTNLVTITTATSHGFSVGDFVSIHNLGYTSGPNPNGLVQITTSATATTFTYALTGAAGSYTFVSATTNQMGRTITNVVFTAAVGPTPAFITFTISGTLFDALNIGEIGNTVLSGLIFTGEDLNGIRQLEVITTSTLKLVVTGTTSAVSLDTSPRMHQLLIDDDASANVRASCLFSDPNDGNKEYVIIALDTGAKKIDLDGYVITDLEYPSGSDLGADTDMIQVFDKVFLFREGQQAFEWYPHGRAITSASSDGTADPNTVVTMNVVGHGLTVGDSVTISGVTGGLPDGTYTVSAVNTADQFEFTGAGITVSVASFGVTDGVMSADFTLSEGGAYTQPQSFASKGNDVEVESGLVTLTVSGNVTLEEGDNVVIYESTIPELSSIVGEEFQLRSATTTELQFFAPIADIKVRELASASVTGSIVKLITTVDHGLPLGSQINVNDVTFSAGTNPNGLHTTERQAPNISSATQLSDVVTITLSGHGFSTSDLITIDGIVFASGKDPNGVFTITVTNSNQFTYPLIGSAGLYTTANAFATIDDLNKRLLYTLAGTSGSYGVASAYITTATGPTSQEVTFGGRFSVGGGFIHQPGAPWGIHFQRRLWVPFYYDPAGTFSVPTYTERIITDEIAVSDILDTSTFDQIANQFRISGGTADFVVAMKGFYDDALVVLNRNSLHLISKTIGSLADTKVTELTSEVGCLARKSVVMRGNLMFFLSDDGVYGVEFLNDYNLRGADEPISKNIQPYIDRINKNFADRAIGVLFENRYYLAVPLDSVVGGNDAFGNNSILVYNFLNKGWESLDTFGDNQFLIKEFVIGSAGVRNNIFVVTSNGGLHQIEAQESSNDILNVTNSNAIVSPTINASLTTRGYDLGTLERKRYTDAQINMQNLLNQSGEYAISFATEDPDDAELIGTTTDFLGGLLTSSANEAETASIRCRLGGIRGFTGTMILTRNIGSPKVNSIKVAGSVTNRQIISQK